MANPIQAAWSILKGDYLPRSERKFTPADPTVNWQYINHLVYTANARGSNPHGDGNSAVFACLLALALGSIEPPLAVFKKTDSEYEPQPEHPFQTFLDDPNPDLDMLELRFWIAWAKHSEGNAYLVKQRSGDAITGLPIALWPVSPLNIRPYSQRGSGNFIDSYQYDKPTGGYDYIPVENVIHFKLGVDPLDPRKGLSPLHRLIREIESDAEATKFMDTLLKNFGIPGLVAQLPAEAILSPDQIGEMKNRLKEEFGGEGRGKVGVLTGGATMAQFGFSPEQLNMKALHDFPETRIAAVMGVDPLVARLGVGLEQTSNYASSRQVRENFTELTLGPNWKMDEAKWNRKLRPDFTNDRNILARHDLSEVRSLQEDENAKHLRIRENFKAGLMTRELALSELGYDANLNPNDTLMVPAGATFMLVSDAVTDPAEQQPALPAGNGTPSEDGPLPPGSKSVNEFISVVQQIVDTAALEFEADLQKLQDSQKRRIERAIVQNGHST